MKSERGALRFETHLSTEPSTPGQNTRFSNSHENSGGTQCIASPPPEGPSPFDSLKSSFDLSRIPQDFPATTPSRVSASLRRGATPERVTMHGLLPLQRIAAHASGDYCARAGGEFSGAESAETADTRSLPAQSRETSRRLGSSGEPTSRRGHGRFCDPPAGVASAVSESAPAAPTAHGVLKLTTLGLIRFYQMNLSPALPSACRFYPSCSAYAYEAVEKWGVRKGVWLATGRLLRCRPWGPFGCDPVPEKRGLGAGDWVLEQAGKAQNPTSRTQNPTPSTQNLRPGA
jgi:putative membrane protein insertion efficiency factor